MSAAQHTPGEWTASIYGGWDAPRVWSPSGAIAILQHHESGPGEAEANARLIAAAPELLKAVKLAASINPFGCVENAAARDAAVAAIAKATRNPE